MSYEVKKSVPTTPRKKVRENWEERRRLGNRCLCLLLVAGYAYHEEGRALIDDARFDRLNLAVLKLWAPINHPHKALLNWERQRKNSSLFYVEFPQRVKGACRAANEDNGKKFSKIVDWLLTATEKVAKLSPS